MHIVKMLLLEHGDDVVEGALRIDRYKISTVGNGALRV